MTEIEKLIRECSNVSELDECQASEIKDFEAYKQSVNKQFKINKDLVQIELEYLQIQLYRCLPEMEHYYHLRIAYVQGYKDGAGC